ncbi:hypothetical protein SLI_0174 [Streptomyces lividans 1326]|uniref:Uncharacterized protein n=1 Tax=Streptomyces lividans 1326 TaxID=1200984 RepID=A0A7U9H815_STRLI|nr:hypothetical protein SLI_0174 [Streptomyces lividans 1326]
MIRPLVEPVPYRPGGTLRAAYSRTQGPGKDPAPPKAAVRRRPGRGDA